MSITTTIPTDDVGGFNVSGRFAAVGLRHLKGTSPFPLSGYALWHHPACFSVMRIILNPFSKVKKDCCFLGAFSLPSTD